MAGDETKVAEVSRQTLGAWRLGGRRPSGTRLFRRFTGVGPMKIAFPKAFVKAKSTQTVLSTGRDRRQGAKRQGSPRSDLQLWPLLLRRLFRACPSIFL